jgi:hypothetical protein
MVSMRIAGSLLASFLLTACAAPLWGQAVANAQLSGSVVDSTGAAVPGAKVTATQNATGQVRTTFSGTDGAYTLPNLPVGPYQIEVQAKGFTTYLQTGIHLEVSNDLTLNVTLSVGEVKQQVAVVANATMVETQSTAVSQVVDQRNVVDLPLNGRQATQLVMLSGGANDIGPANGMSDLTGSKNYFSADAISVAGGQANGTNYLLDGGEHMDTFSNVNLPFPFPDAIQEFSVQTSSLSAQYGLHAGAVVNVVTKSGTNQFHGDAFEFVRNGYFDARDFFAATTDTLKRNQFGGTIGAPIRKDKIFGFFGYQGTIIRTAPPSSIAHVPTQAVLGGDFSQLESAACQSSGTARTIIDPTTGNPFPNNIIPASRLNQQALKLASYLPVSSNPCGEVTYAIPEPQKESQYIGRVDWNQSARHNLFGRYFFADYKSPASFDNDLLLTTQRGVLDRSQSVTIGDTYSINPTTVNSLHATWTRLAITRGPASDFISLTDIGVNMYSAAPNYLDVAVNGYFGGGCGTCAPSVFDQDSYQAAEDLDMVRGRHHISLGVDYVHYQFNQRNYVIANGSMTFNGQSSGDALADFMLGLPSLFEQGNVQPFDGRQNYFGAYVHDNIRLSKRLSVQLGLRWEPYLPEREKFNRMQHFDAAAFAAGTQTDQYVNAPPGLFFPGDPGIPSASAYPRYGIFEPRVGLAWDPTGSGRQTIRAGYGLFYDTMETAYQEDQTGDAPWASTIDLPSPAGGLTNPFLGYPGGNPFPSPSPPSKNQFFPPEGQYYNYPLHAHPTSVNQWNVSYERQLGNNWLVSGTYIGNKSSHIWTGEDVDPGVYIPGTCGGSPCSTTSNTNQRRVLYLQNPVAGSLISDIYQADDGANAEYQGLLLKAEHRFSNHYSILGNYTWAHCISEADAEGDLGGPQTQNPYNRNGERGNCGFDLRGTFNLTFVIQSPHLANAWANRLLGNWQLAPIFSIHTGQWFSVFTGVDNSLTGVNLDRPNVVGNPYVRNTSTLQWLNPSAFVPNALGTFGDVGSDSLLGPAFFNIDAAVSKRFNVRETQQLELRFEFFNITNHVNFNVPNLDSNIQDPTFGQLLGDVAPRILQFAVKYTF